ncbi:MAG: bifunctional chorismate mutase/prephenate dehydratase [Butyrivibrio sp.]|nr:bifunctional chorismate mutase/prephenate dehydratase [Butyrivibrio sp.]
MFVDLQESRRRIDEIDGQIVELFEKRMLAASDVADYKMATGKPVFDRDRENQKIEKLVEMTDGDFNRKCVAELFTQIMAMSRKLQYQKLEGAAGGSLLEPYEILEEVPRTGVRVVYQGVPGAYSHEAMTEFFGRNVDCVNVGSFREAMQRVASKEADYGVIPIDNSSAGMVSDTYDLLQEYSNYIVAETFLKIEHCLLVKPGTDTEGIRRVYSHPQALMQCAKYLDAHGGWRRESYPNTAMSAKKIADEDDYTQAAIGSPNCASEYGLEIAARGINSASANTTRFVIVSSKRAFVKNASKVSICFEVDHRAGSLYNALSHIMFNGLNMTKIESRPIPEHNWEFRFFIDFEGNLADAGVRNALRGIAEESNALKLLGNY